MQIVPVSEGEKSGAEALHAWVGLGHLTHIVEVPADGQLRYDRPSA